MLSRSKQTYQALKQRYFTGPAKSVALLTTGTVIANVIPIGVLPVLTRLYAAEQFGYLATYVACVSFLMPFCSFEYGHAIVYATNNDDVKKLLSLSVLINLLVTAIIFILLLMVDDAIASLFGVKELSGWFLTMPLAFLFFGLTHIFNYWGTKNSLFKVLSVGKVVRAVTTAAVSIVLGYKGYLLSGLIVGFLAGYLANFLFLLRYVVKIEKSLTTSFNALSITLKSFKAFPLYNLPANWFTAISTEFPVYFISHYFGLAAAGYFDRTRQILNAPLYQIGTSLSDVFKKTGMDIIIRGESIRPLFLKTFKYISLLAIPFTVVTVFFAPALFGFVLGDGWRIAGVYAQIMIIMFSLRLISMPLCNMYFIAGKHRENFLMGVLQLLFLIIFMYLAYYLVNDINIVLFFYSIAYAIFYSIGILRSYKFTLQ